MKRLFAVFLTIFSLVGCSHKNSSMDKLYQFRNDLLQANVVSFDAEITTDYGQEYYTFQVSCSGDESGDLAFEVISPETISGIRGNVSREEGNLTFDDHILAFKTMAEDRLTPVTAPWVFLTALRGGYITSCGKTEDGYLAIIRDTYLDDYLSIDVSFQEDVPINADVFWNQTRIISMKITNFRYS